MLSFYAVFAFFAVRVLTTKNAKSTKKDEGIDESRRNIERRTGKSERPMRRYPFRCILLGLLVAVVQACNHEPTSRPNVAGSARFKEQVHRAIGLLQQRDLIAYQVVTNNIGLIKEGDHSGMWAYTTPPVYVMSDVTAFYSVTWCAATIAHDSFHSKLYHDYQRSHPGAVPDSVWEGRTAELQCMTYQIDVMRKIGATDGEISYALTVASGDYVTNADSWLEYSNRSW